MFPIYQTQMMQKDNEGVKQTVTFLEILNN